MKANGQDLRDMASLRRHYEIEKELADRLRAAPQESRATLYSQLYDELFARVPDHPQNMWKDSSELQEARAAEQLRLLQGFLGPHTVYLEVGAGDCFLARKVATQVRAAIGVDVSEVISGSKDRPSNFVLHISDGTGIPVADNIVTVVFSNMLIEHLHSDDLALHLQEVYRVLAPGGVYVCRTPHRFAGPTDISGYFDREATGFHLKEYTFCELSAKFRGAGFAPIGVRARVKGRVIPCPARVVRVIETALSVLPYRIRKALSRCAMLRPLFATATVVARKRI